MEDCYSEMILKTGSLTHFQKSRNTLMMTTKTTIRVGRQPVLRTSFCVNNLVNVSILSNFVIAMWIVLMATTKLVSYYFFNLCSLNINFFISSIFFQRVVQPTLIGHVQITNFPVMLTNVFQISRFAMVLTTVWTVLMSICICIIGGI